MLEKHGVAFESLEIDAEAEQTRTTPKVFAKIALVYRVVADPAARESIERAIVASQKRFCGVSEMLRKTADLTWTLEIVAPGA
jgi:putative redox protein